jgi:hypothetical protein
MIQLSPIDREWVQKKWRLIRESQVKADKANADWNRINDEINDKHRRDNQRRIDRGDFPLSDIMIAEAKSASLALQDALATGNWHSRNAERHIHDVNLFLQLKQMGIL